MGLLSVQSVAATTAFVTTPPPPFQVSTNPVTMSEGNATPLVVATFSSADGVGTVSASNPYTATIDWGDGTSAETCTSTTTSCSVVEASPGQFQVRSQGHAYADDGTYTTRVFVTDTVDGDTTDAAIGKTAGESSIYLGSPQQAVDGNTNGDFGAGSVTHTYDSYQPWWQVDLGAATPISTIDIWNRTGCCPDRLSNFYVFTSSTPFAFADAGSTLNAICGTTVLGSSCAGAKYQTAYPAPASSFSFNLTARYVRVQLTGSGIPLSLAEVVVHGPVWFTTTVTEDANISGLVGNPVNAVEGVSTGNLVLGTFPRVSGPGAVGDLTSTIDWGDGSSRSAGTIGYDSGSGLYTVTGSHLYADEAVTYSDVVLADHPNEYWRLDQTSGFAQDSSGHGLSAENLGGISNSQAGATADGDRSTAFDGTTGYFEAPYSSLTNPAVFSVEAWAFVTRSTGSYQTVASSRACSGGYNGWTIYAGAGGGWEFWLGNGVYPWTTIGGGQIQYNTWTHLVGTSDGTTAQFYVNGQLMATGPGAFRVNACSPLRIGAGAPEQSPQFFFLGSIDEVAVYPRVLDAASITRHIQASRATGRVTVTVADGDVSAAVSSTLHVSDAPLTVTAPISYRPTAGDAAARVVATIVDASTTATAAELSALIDWGGGASTGNGTIVALGGGAFQVWGTHGYPREGAYTVRVTVTDQGGSTGGVVYGIGVADGILTAAGSEGPFNTSPGVSTWMNLNYFNDSGLADASDYSATISWGDGTSDSGCAAYSATPTLRCWVSGDTVHARHAYASIGTYTYTVNLRDIGGARLTMTGSIRVTAPALALVMNYTGLQARPGVSYVFPPSIAHFDDPDGNVTDRTVYSVTVIWGDGASGIGSLSYSGGHWQVAVPAHTYTYAGSYTLRLIVKDTDGSAASAQVRVTVSTQILT